MITIDQVRSNIAKEYRKKSIEELLNVFFEDEFKSVKSMLAAQIIQEKYSQEKERSISNFFLLILGALFLGFSIGCVVFNYICSV